jgi:hypothetical protein
MPAMQGRALVCENHPRLAWPSECSCGAGDPCPVCNVAGPPQMPEGFVRDEDADAALQAAIEDFAKKMKSPPR